MSPSSSIRRNAIFLLVAVWFLHPQTGARGGIITFNDLSGNVTVFDTTGRITSSGCMNEHCFVTLSAPLQAVSASGSLMALNIRESAGGQISDVLILNFTLSAATIEFVSDFVSDMEGVVLDPVPGPFIVENNTVQNAANIIWTLADGSAVVDVIAFISDIPDVSEPGSVALLSIGLIGLGLIRNKRSRLPAAGGSRVSFPR